MNCYKPKGWIESALGSRAALGVSRAMGRLADITLPRSVVKPIADIYTAALGVDVTDTVLPEDKKYPFNAFFGRHLKEDARPLDPAPDALVSPCDGQIVSMGRIDNDEAAFSIKSSRYSLGSLLGEETAPKPYIDGAYAVIYLHPRDYHRVHVPFDVMLTRSRHIPGTRFPVTGWCEKIVENIYNKNERMVFSAELPSAGSLTLVMVAAFGVGNIETRFDPGVDAKMSASREQTYEPARQLRKGEELGAFLLGSTVVLLGSKGVLELDERLEWGPIKMGQRIGRVITSNDKP